MLIRLGHFLKGCLGFWVPCVLYSRTNKRLRTNPSSLETHSCCNSVVSSFFQDSVGRTSNSSKSVGVTSAVVWGSPANGMKFDTVIISKGLLRVISVERSIVARARFVRKRWKCAIGNDRLRKCIAQDMWHHNRCHTLGHNSALWIFFFGDFEEWYVF